MSPQSGLRGIAAHKHAVRHRWQVPDMLADCQLNDFEFVVPAMRLERRQLRVFGTNNILSWMSRSLSYRKSTDVRLESHVPNRVLHRGHRSREALRDARGSAVDENAFMGDADHGTGHARRPFRSTASMRTDFARRVRGPDLSIHDGSVRARKPGWNKSLTCRCEIDLTSWCCMSPTACALTR